LGEAYEDGTLNSESIYINGKMDGLYIIYYDNGKIVSKQMYNNGIKEGTGIHFNSNGELWYEENYKDGRLDGIIKYYDYEDSKLERITEYQNGKRNGNEMIYRDSGTLWSISSYKLDKRNGMTFFYWENGQIWFEIPIVDYRIVDTVYEYMPDGMKWREYQYNNGRQHGNQIYYFREYDSWIYGEFGNDYKFLIKEFGDIINNNYITLEFEHGKIVSKFSIKGYYNNNEKWLDANYLNGEIINGTIYKTENSQTRMTEHGCLLLSEIIKNFSKTPGFENWIN
jgi:antitoxin component YwqK of YwqJK toxin-antitoxin module